MIVDPVPSRVQMFLFATADAVDRDGAELGEAKALLREWLSDDREFSYPQWVWDLVARLEHEGDPTRFCAVARNAGLRLLGHPPTYQE